MATLEDPTPWTEPAGLTLSHCGLTLHRRQNQLIGIITCPVKKQVGAKGAKGAEWERASGWLGGGTPGGAPGPQQSCCSPRGSGERPFVKVRDTELLEGTRLREGGVQPSRSKAKLGTLSGSGKRPSAI